MLSMFKIPLEQFLPEFPNVWQQNFTMVTSYRPLPQFTLSCSIHLLCFWWFRPHLTDVILPKSHLTLNHFVQYSIISDTNYDSYTTLLRYSSHLLLPCAIWLYAEQFHAMLCHLMLCRTV